MTDPMLDTMEVRQEIINGLSIGPMYFDFGLPWTGLLQGHQNCTSNIAKMVTYTIIVSMEVE